MIKSRLIRLHSTLNKKEIRQFKLWINSPIHNQHQNSLKLFNFIHSRHTLSSITLQKERAYKFIFPSETYKEERLRYLMNSCFNLLKKFVGYNQSVSDHFDYQKNIIEGLKERNLSDLARIELDKLNIEVRNKASQNAANSLQLFELERNSFELRGTQNRSIQTNLPKIFTHLTDFYTLSMLKYACVAGSHSNITQQNYTIPLLDGILEEAVQSQHPIVLLYYNLYQTLSQRELDTGLYFEQAGALFLKHYRELLPQEQNEILLLLINYCIKRRLSIDAESFVKKGFEWYRWGLEHAVLIQKNKLSRFAYLNIVGMGLQLFEFDWVAQFITQYIQYLPSQFQENYQHYTTAKLLFKQKKYAKAQRLLTQIEYDDIFLNLDSKTILLEIYYEEKSWDSLEALLVSFSRYLQRKKVIAYHKKVYKNIISLTRKLMSLPPYDKAAKKALLEEIKTTNPLAERDWLLKQIELLS
ncbi:MAG: Unknown protein [uncultured Aureispira sp.]|uniref:Uncharacterized protein n=1 Tax=uncultured Aureispira sp. TaxID=1331704 RepID=A0A6S6SYZ9_9BACT|nr:MAG: Unknown protein [uncultured Aureispira sp.]